MNKISNNLKSKLVVMLSRFPFPLEKGDKLRAYYQIIELSKSFDITLITISDHIVSEKSIQELEKYCKEIHVFQLPKWKSLFQSFIGLFGAKPIQISFFYNYSIHKKINSIVKELRPNHIYCQLIRTTEYLKNYHNCPKTLDYMDAFSKGIERRIPLQSIFTKWIFKLEAKRLAQYEREVYDYFEIQTIISEQDAEALGTLPNQPVSCIPNGVSESFLTFSTDKLPEFDIVFVGNLNYPPNVQAVKFILDKILPIAKEKGYDWKFLAAGAGPSKQLMDSIDSNLQATILANVDDIRQAYCAGKVFVAPMQIGTGLQNKLLEAMALGIPCVTTPLANNALKALEIEEITIADSAEEFVKNIHLLLTNEKSESIGKKGKQLILKNFNWENSTEILTKAIQKA
ncbi:MAG: glycosyltransferase [Crocinitomicaceae bacterium]|nr:glycosyltransferase [Crocinitomicaceae bacterium]